MGIDDVAADGKLPRVEAPSSVPLHGSTADDLVVLRPRDHAAANTVRSLLTVASELAPHRLAVVRPLDTRTAVILGGWPEQQVAVGLILERIGYARIPVGEFVFEGWALGESRIVFEDRVCVVHDAVQYRFEDKVAWLETA